MNYFQILKKGENFLKKSKISNPFLDTELILSKVLKRKREEILLNINNKLKNEEIFRFNYYLSKTYISKNAYNQEYMPLVLFAVFLINNH